MATTSTTTGDLEVTHSNSPRVSRYDHFSAGLIASIIVVGFLVLSLAMVWLFGGDRNFQYATPLVDPDVVIEDDEGNVEQPEFDEVIKGPTDVDLTNSLESIQDAISRVKASGGLDGKGAFSGPGPRIPGPTPPLPIESPSKRWKMSFEVADIEQYRSQLDHFGIEICVVHPTNQDVWRLGDLGSGVEVTESSRSKENGHKSVFFANVNPKLKSWDRKIVTEAGLDPEDKLIIQFFPKLLIAQIIKLEAQKLEELGRTLEEVTETHIKLERSGEQFSISISGFEFR